VSSALPARLRGALRVVLEIAAAHLTAFLASLGGALRVVLEVPTALLPAFLAGLRCSLAIFGKVSRTATVLGIRHRTSPFLIFAAQAIGIPSGPRRLDPVVWAYRPDVRLLAVISINKC